jgi:elongation factor Ts
MAEISAKLVKELRDKTGAGMMDCKKALKENEGDMEKATEWLRQKGIASAAKKEGRVAAEGLIGQYIHTGGRVGVRVEVNCETDFVAMRDEFKTLVRDVAMQIAACPNVEYVRTSDIPQDMMAKEKEIEMGREDLASKPENIREKIVEGRIEKRMKELSLMDQPFIKDQNISVEELVKQHVATLGENIQVRRFSRFVLGEGIEKEETDFAAEVAAQTGQKQAAAEAVEEPAKESAPEATKEAKGTKKKGGKKKK